MRSIQYIEQREFVPCVFLVFFFCSSFLFFVFFSSPRSSVIVGGRGVARRRLLPAPCCCLLVILVLLSCIPPVSRRHVLELLRDACRSYLSCCRVTPVSPRQVLELLRGLVKVSSSVSRNYSTSHLSDLRGGHGGGSANYDDLSLISAQFHAEVRVVCMYVGYSIYVYVYVYSVYVYIAYACEQFLGVVVPRSCVCYVCVRCKCVVLFYSRCCADGAVALRVCWLRLAFGVWWCMFVFLAVFMFVHFWACRSRVVGTTAAWNGICCCRKKRKK